MYYYVLNVLSYLDEGVEDFIHTRTLLKRLYEVKTIIYQLTKPQTSALIYTYNFNSSPEYLFV